MSREGVLGGEGVLGVFVLDEPEGDGGVTYTQRTGLRLLYKDALDKKKQSLMKDVYISIEGNWPVRHGL